MLFGKNQQTDTICYEEVSSLLVLLHGTPSFFLTDTYQTEYSDSDLAQEETALAAYEEAITLAPKAGTLHFHKGQILEQMGRTVEAQNAFATAHHLGYRSRESYN